MGNKLGRRRLVVDEKYTRPQGLYQHRDVDHKKLRKLILDSKLAPCYPGDDDCACDLEECPICFSYYPSLNRSRCCMKGICTECFLQMKTPNSSRPTQCPFCKTSNYAVEYRGVKTKEEKGLEQLEEQRVIKAQIRMRQKELLDEEERMLKQREINSSSTRRETTEVGYCSTTAPSISPAIEIDEIIDSHEQDTSSTVRPSPHPRQNRENGFDLDLEDIMVMEAIWLSIQENDRPQEPHAALPEEEMAIDHSSITMMAPVAAGTSFSSPSAGLACAIAALAERQLMSGENSNNYIEDILHNTPRCSRYSNQHEQESIDYFPPGIPHIISADGPLALSANPGDWMVHGSEVAEVGTSYGGPNETDVATFPAALPQRDENHSGLQPVGGLIIPESFEEQMMLANAMAVSLAEARARSNTPGVGWH